MNVTNNSDLELEDTRQSLILCEPPVLHSCGERSKSTCFVISDELGHGLHSRGVHMRRNCTCMYDVSCSSAG